jgi:thioesterase domain-containing protein
VEATEEAARVLALFAREAGLSADEGELRTLSPESQIERVAALAVSAGLLTQTAATGYLSRRLAVYQANVRAARQYAPALYPGRITLLRAAEFPGDLPGGDAAGGWHRHAAGGLDIHVVPGGHRTILREPHVRRLAETLGQLLCAARSPLPVPSGENAEIHGQAPVI